MKRPASVSQSYLQQLAAPLPHPALLVHARQPSARRAGSVLDSIPRILESEDSIDSVETFADHAGPPDSPTAASIPRNAYRQTTHDRSPIVLSSARSADRASNEQREAISLPVASAAAPPNVESSHAKGTSQPAAPRSSLRRPAATDEAAPQESARLDAKAAPQLSTASLRTSSTEVSSLPFASSSASRVETQRGGVQVHIGTVEVRVAAPPPQPPATNHHRDPIPSHTGRPAHAEPLSRGLAWSHGLVQG